MTWEISWRGLACDYDPGNVQMQATPNERAHAQAMAIAVVDALREYEPNELVIVRAMGQAGQFTYDTSANLSISSSGPEPAPIGDQLAAQQPASVLQNAVPTGGPTIGSAERPRDVTLRFPALSYPGMPPSGSSVDSSRPTQLTEDEG